MMVQQHSADCSFTTQCCLETSLFPFETALFKCRRRWPGLGRNLPLPLARLKYHIWIKICSETCHQNILLLVRTSRAAGLLLAFFLLFFPGLSHVMLTLQACAGLALLDCYGMKVCAAVHNARGQAPLGYLVLSEHILSLYYCIKHAF